MIMSSKWIFNGMFGGQKRCFLKRMVSKMNCKYAFLHHSRICLAENKIKIAMPSLSPTMTEGTIMKWLKNEGDNIEPGDVLCEIQTDKAVVGLETEEEGVLSKILIPEDTKNVKLGEIIAIITVEGDFETEKEILDAKSEEKLNKTKTIEGADQKEKKIDFLRLCGPSVKKLATEYGINYSDVNGSGPRDNILKGDILRYIHIKNMKKQTIVSDSAEIIAKPEVKVTKTKTHIDIPVSTSKKAVARQLIQSKASIPHAYMNVDCEINSVFNFMQTMKSDGTNVSFGDFLVKSAATALRRVPKLNVMCVDGNVKSLNAINISINVPKGDSYVTPVIENADNLSVELISKEVSTLSEKATEWKLENEKFTDGIFRITDLGLFGVTEFSSIIYPPEVAILAVGKVQHTLKDYFPIRKIRATLSFNNEIISENEAGAFLSAFKEHLEHPLSLCLS